MTNWRPRGLRVCGICALLAIAVCAGPQVIAADEPLARAFASILPRALDPQPVQLKQEEWLNERDNPEALYFDESSALAALSNEEHRLNVLESARNVSEMAARRACPPIFADNDGDCPAQELGTIGTVGRQVLLYGLYGFRAANHELLGNRIVIYRRQAVHDWLRALFAFEIDGTFYDKPQILRLPDRILLHVPGEGSGTGHPNNERVFIWRRGRWAPLDTTSWINNDFPRRLPHLYPAWGVFPDYRKLTATTALSRLGDANCCPTGGTARLTFAWNSDRLVIVKTRRLRPTEPRAAITPLRPR